MSTLTKIMVTVGPASVKPDILRKFFRRGVRIFRFNFKHNTVKWHREHIKFLRKLAKEEGVIVTVVLDLQGPSVRVRLNKNKIRIKEGVPYVLTSNPSDENQIGITYPRVIDEIKNGSVVYMSEGTLKFIAERSQDQLMLIPLNSGTLRNGVSFNVEGVTFSSLPVLTQRDKEGLDLAKKNLVDYVAVSFVRNKNDLLEVKKELEEREIYNVGVMSKIETQEALRNLNEIIDNSDAIMIGRGDLALEVPYYQVPYWQKHIIQECRERSKPVIVATQMLESLVEKNFPTRAEIVDVANAVYDKADVLVLSGETAIGQDPLLAVEMMDKIVSYAEEHRVGCEKFYPPIRSEADKVAKAVYDFYLQYDSDDNVSIVFFVEDEKVLDRFVRLRPSSKIYVVHNKGLRFSSFLNLRFGVRGIIFYDPENLSEDQALAWLVRRLAKKGLVKPKHRLIVFFDRNFTDFGSQFSLRLIEV